MVAKKTITLSDFRSTQAFPVKPEIIGFCQWKANIKNFWHQTFVIRVIESRKTILFYAYTHFRFEPRKPIFWLISSLKEIYFLKIQPCWSAYHLEQSETVKKSWSTYHLEWSQTFKGSSSIYHSRDPGQPTASSKARGSTGFGKSISRARSFRGLKI